MKFGHAQFESLTRDLVDCTMAMTGKHPPPSHGITNTLAYSAVDVHNVHPHPRCWWQQRRTTTPIPASMMSKYFFSYTRSILTMTVASTDDEAATVAAISDDVNSMTGKHPSVVQTPSLTSLPAVSPCHADSATNTLTCSAVDIDDDHPHPQCRRRQYAQPPNLNSGVDENDHRHPAPAIVSTPSLGHPQPTTDDINHHHLQLSWWWQRLQQQQQQWWGYIILVLM